MKFSVHSTNRRTVLERGGGDTAFESAVSSNSPKPMPIGASPESLRRCHRTSGRKREAEGRP